MFHDWKDNVTLIVIVSDLGNCLQIETLARITVMLLKFKNSRGVGQVRWNRGKKITCPKTLENKKHPWFSSSPSLYPSFALTPNPGLIFLNRLQNSVFFFSQNRLCKARSTVVIISREAHRPGRVWPKKTYFYISPQSTCISPFSPSLQTSPLTTHVRVLNVSKK